MRRLLLVVNPCAGQRAGVRSLGDILKVFSDSDVLTSVHFTKARGDATDFVREHASQYDIVTCIGGDGTFNETVSGVIASGADVPIGYIPAGSTNDFARSMHLSSNLLSAARVVVAEDSVPVALDVGSFDDRIFTYVASFGAFTRSSYSTPQNVKNALGYIAYILEGIKDIPSIGKEHLLIETDRDTVEGDYIFGAVSNSTSLGGFLKLDDAIVDMSDGKLELILIKAPSNAVELMYILHALNTKKYNGDWISLCSSERLTVHTERPMDWTLDGEHGRSEGDLTIRNRHHAIRLISPKSEETPEN